MGPLTLNSVSKKGKICTNATAHINNTTIDCRVFFAIYFSEFVVSKSCF